MVAILVVEIILAFLNDKPNFSVILLGLLGSITNLSFYHIIYTSYVLIIFFIGFFNLIKTYKLRFYDVL